ncbi:MAG: diphthamide synthesis protein [Candidatus Pacearchaeota archaeon]|jgi:2-(3-amino-3-carboxypropyl)histidine synthase
MTRVVFIENKWQEKVELNKKVIDYLVKNKIKSIALFASIQFTNVDEILKQLKELNINVLVTKAKRADKLIQILGCDCYSDCFKEDIISEADLTIYIGDGLFHPKALLLSQIKSQEIKPILAYNPISQTMNILDKKEIEKQINKIKRNLKLYFNAKTIGILVSVKFGQQFLQKALDLKNHLKSQGKNVYIFIEDSINPNEFENFNFIDAWVNSACPRIATDDILNINKPLINIKDAFNPLEVLDELK